MASEPGSDSTKHYPLGLGVGGLKLPTFTIKSWLLVDEKHFCESFIPWLQS